MLRLLVRRNQQRLQGRDVGLALDDRAEKFLTKSGLQRKTEMRIVDLAQKKNWTGFPRLDRAYGVDLADAWIERADIAPACNQPFIRPAHQNDPLSDPKHHAAPGFIHGAIHSARAAQHIPSLINILAMEFLISLQQKVFKSREPKPKFREFMSRIPCVLLFQGVADTRHELAELRLRLTRLENLLLQ